MGTDRPSDPLDQALLGYVDALLADRKRPPDRDEDLHLTVLDLLMETVPLAAAPFRSRLNNEVEAVVRRRAAREASRSPLRLVALRIGIVVLAVAALIATPWVRSFAQHVIRFFTPAPMEPVSFETVIHPEEPTYYASLAEAERAVGFSAKTPDQLPSGYVVDEIRAYVSGQVLTILYRGPANDTPVMTPMVALTQRKTPFDDLVGPDAAIEEVLVAGEWGEYLKGGWMYVEVEGEGQEEEFRWEETLVPVQSLRWMSEGIYYGISFVGSDTQPGYLDKDDLIRMAESLR